MRRGWAVWAITLAGLSAGVAVRAQNEQASAPPSPGAAVPAGFRAYVVVDDRYAPKVSPPKRQDDRDPRDRTRMMHDLVVEHGLNPTVAVFTRTRPAQDAPAARLAQQLDPLVERHRANNFGAFVVFLTLDREFPLDDRRTAEGQFLRDLEAEAVRTLADTLKTPRVPFALAARESPQAAAWGIGDHDLVVVLYDRLKVVRAWAFPAGQAPTDEQVKEILAEAEKLAAGK
jgi:hypothetical protein